MKKSKDETINIEEHARSNTHLEVKTCRDQFGSFYYLLYVNYKKNNNKWNNRSIIIKQQDIHAVNSLLHKSSLFTATLPKPCFVNAKKLYEEKNAKLPAVS